MAEFAAELFECGNIAPNVASLRSNATGDQPGVTGWALRDAGAQLSLRRGLAGCRWLRRSRIDAGGLRDAVSEPCVLRLHFILKGLK
jgi:hypothetical protein